MPYRLYCTYRRLGRGVAALLIVLLGLTACRTSPTVAAYVGGQKITTTDLDQAVERGLSDKGVAAAYGNRLPDYRQIVLQNLINVAVYDAAAQRYEVAVNDADVTSRLDQVLAQTGDPQGFYDQQATQGQTRADIRERVRQFIVGEQIAQAAGLSDPTSEASLRQLYETTKSQYARYQAGLITAKDQAAADAVLARLTADPSSYPAEAAALAGPNTLPALQSVTGSQLTGVGADLPSLKAGQGYTAPLLQTGEITVVFIAAVEYPTFENLRPTLTQQAGDQVQTAVQAELKKVRDSLDITVNPRFGTFDESGALVPDDNGVVSVVEQPTPAPPQN
ncbi:MAG: SurA N-terminal domain-containing protein [Geodermatophilaceae bacterium]